jgi:hypothetical protein
VFQVFRSLFLSPISVVTAPAGSPVPGLDAWIPRRIAYLLLAMAPAIPLAAAMHSALDRGGRGTLTRAMLAALVLPLAAVLAVSHRVPLWLPRYFVFLTPFIAVLIARGLSSLRPRIVAVAAALLLFGSSAYGCWLYDVDYTKERWRDVVNAIAARSPAGRTAVLVPFDVDPFRFYDVKLASPLAAIEVSHPEVPFASNYSPRQLEEMERRAAERSAPYEEVWVVVRSPNSPVRKQVVVRANRVAAIGRSRVGRWRWDSTGGPVWATRYVRETAPNPGGAGRDTLSRAR